MSEAGDDFFENLTKMSSKFSLLVGLIGVVSVSEDVPSEIKMMAELSQVGIKFCFLFKLHCT